MPTSEMTATSDIRKSAKANPSAVKSGHDKTEVPQAARIKWNKDGMNGANKQQATVKLVFVPIVG